MTSGIACHTHQLPHSGRGGSGEGANHFFFIQVCIFSLVITEKERDCQEKIHALTRSIKILFVMLTLEVILSYLKQNHQLHSRKIWLHFFTWRFL